MSTLISAAAVQTAAGRLGDSVLIDNDLVVAVGERSELGARANAEHRYEDAVILPGLRDSHFHPVGYTAALNGTTLGGIVDLAEMREVLGAAAARIAPGDALIATRFNDTAVAEQRLPTRADLDRATGAMPPLVHRHCGDDLPEARRRIERAGPRLRWAGVKIFADGSLGGHTAAMDAPFSDALGETGTLRLTPDDLELANASLHAGGMVAIHAIGDRANTTVLNPFETIIEMGAPPGRLRLEHASVLNPADVERIGRTGIVTSVQPAFLGSEVDWLEDRVGPDRLPFTYPLRSLQRAGATLAGGSDCPVESPNPFAGMALAIDRAGIVVEEGLEPAAALGLFTQATALQEPAPLATGSPADLIVVDRNPVEVTPDELRQTRVLGTFVDGVEVEVERTRPYWVD